MLYLSFIFLFIRLWIESYALEPSKDLSNLSWNSIDEGLEYCEFVSPIFSPISDNKISLLRINPEYFELVLLCASEYNTEPKYLDQWCEENMLVGGVNATMFRLSDGKTAVGYMKNYNHYNNSVLKEGYNAMAVFGKKVDRKDLPHFKIIDMHEEDWKSYTNYYNCFIQSIRMIDGKGKQVVWKKSSELKSSMSVLAEDSLGNVLICFTRSPYSANEFSKILLMLPLKIRSAMYLDGGPEACLYLYHNGYCIQKYGSYASNGYKTDKNNEYWKIPNIIGFKKRIVKQ